jgi:hypothetical protein
MPFGRPAIGSSGFGISHSSSGRSGPSGRSSNISIYYNPKTKEYGQKIHDAINIYNTFAKTPNDTNLDAINKINKEIRAEEYRNLYNKTIALILINSDIFEPAKNPEEALVSEQNLVSEEDLVSKIINYIKASSESSYLQISSYDIDYGLWNRILDILLLVYKNNKEGNIQITVKELLNNINEMLQKATLTDRESSDIIDFYFEMLYQVIKSNTPLSTVSPSVFITGYKIDIKIKKKDKNVKDTLKDALSQTKLKDTLKNIILNKDISAKTKEAYLNTMMKVVELLIGEYRGWGINKSDDVKLKRRIDAFCKKASENRNFLLGKPADIAKIIIRDDRANNKGGRKTRKNRRRTTRKNRKTSSNRIRKRK